MKVAIISPSRTSEKAISTISFNLVDALDKQEVNADMIEYSAGSSLSFLKQISKIRKYDVVNLQHEYNLLGWYGLPFFLMLPLMNLYNHKITISMHTVLSQKQKFEGGFLKNFLRKGLYSFQNFFIKVFSEKVIVNEDFLKRILVEEYGLDSEKVLVIPQPVVEKPKLLNKEKAKKELGISGKMYLTIGNLTEDNGADIVIRQADKIGKTIMFVTNPAGVNTRNSKRVQNYIRLNKEIVSKRGFEDYVRFDLKKIPHELWWKYFSAADLVIQAYRGGIRSGVFSDAMVAKVPVVASNIPFFREMKSKYGSLKIAENEQDYPKRIKEALKPEEYSKLKKACERYVEKNNLTSISKKYKELFYKMNGPDKNQ